MEGSKRKFHQGKKRHFYCWKGSFSQTKNPQKGKLHSAFFPPLFKSFAVFQPFTNNNLENLLACIKYTWEKMDAAVHLPLVMGD